MIKKTTLSRRLSVSLSPELSERIIELADKWGTSEAQVARRLMLAAVLNIKDDVDPMVKPRGRR